MVRQLACSPPRAQRCLVGAAHRRRCSRPKTPDSVFVLSSLTELIAAFVRVAVCNFGACVLRQNYRFAGRVSGAASWVSLSCALRWGGGHLNCIRVAWSGHFLPSCWARKGYAICILFDMYRLRCKTHEEIWECQTLSVSLRDTTSTQQEKFAVATVTCNPLLLLPLYSQLSDKEPGLTDRKSIAIKKT